MRRTSSNRRRHETSRIVRAELASRGVKVSPVQHFEDGVLMDGEGGPSDNSSRSGQDDARCSCAYPGRWAHRRRQILTMSGRASGGVAVKRSGGKLFLIDTAGNSEKVRRSRRSGNGRGARSRPRLSRHGGARLIPPVHGHGCRNVFLGDHRGHLPRTVSQPLASFYTLGGNGACGTHGPVLPRPDAHTRHPGEQESGTLDRVIAQPLLEERKRPLAL